MSAINTSGISWKNPVTGDWSVASDWSTGVVPGSANDVTIGVTGASYTVTITAPESAHSVTVSSANATFQLSNTLTLGGNLSVTAGSVQLLSGGTIAGGTIQDSGGRLTFGGGTLSGVTYQGTLNVSAPSGYSSNLFVRNGLTLTGAGGTGSGTLNITDPYSSVYVYDTTTLDNATINIGNAGSWDYLYAYDDVGGNQTLTLGTGLNLVHGAGYAQLQMSGYGTDAIVNKGTITAAASGGQFYLANGSGGFTNQGSIAVSNGDTVYIQPTNFTNAGTVSVTGGATLTMGGYTAWTNTGTISETGATLNLGGTYNTATLGTITRSGGAVNITGTDTNTGATLNVGTGTALGTVNLFSGGTIAGGTISDAGGGLTFGGGTLSGVTYQGTLNVSAPSGYSSNLFVRNGLTLTGAGGTGSGTLNITDPYSSVYVYDTTTLDNATINIGNAGSWDYLYAYDDVGGNQTLTLGTGLNLVHGAGYAQLQMSGYGTDAIVNKGTITAAASGGQFYLANGSGGFTNQGSIAVSNGDTVYIQPTNFTNAGTVSVTGGATLTMGGYTAWTNTGTISETGATLNLGGTYNTATLGTITRSGGAVNITGTDTNTGATLNVGTGTALGTVNLFSGGTIAGGTISDAGGGLTFGGGTLSGVTYQGTLNVSAPSGYSPYLFVRNGLTLTGAGGTGSGTLNITDPSSAVYVYDTTTLDNATINIGNASNWDYLYAYDDVGGNQTLTLGTGLNLVHGAGYAQLQMSGYSTDAIVNKGTITAAASGGTFYLANGSGGFTNQGSIAVSNGDTVYIQPTNFTNAGTVSVTGGATLTMGGYTAWTNTGTISETGATLNLGGTYNTATLGTITRSGGAVNITGTDTNTGATLNVGTGTALGTVNLFSGGTIAGGTISDAGGGLTFGGGTLSGVTYQGTLNVSAPSGYSPYLFVRNGLTLTGAGGTGSGTLNITDPSSAVYVYDTTTLDNATINMGGAGTYDALYLYDDIGGNQTLTLAAGLNLLHNGGTAQLYMSGYSTDAIVNKGTITAAASGGTFYLANGNGSFTNQGSIAVSNDDTVTIQPTSLTNAGTMSVASSATLTIGGTDWTNTGTISETDATLNLGGTYNTATLGTITRSGGVVNITGTDTNTGATLNVGTGTALGTVNLYGTGTIAGGTINDAGSGLTFSGGTLSGVTYQGTLNVSSPSGYSPYLYVRNGLTLTGAGGTGSGTLNITDPSSAVYVYDTTTLDNATINIGNASSWDYLYAYDDVGGNQTLTLGTGLHLVHSATYAELQIAGYSTDTIVNEGTITAAASGGQFYLGNGSGSFTNQGSIAVSNGDTVYLQPTTWTNMSGTTLTGGTYEVDAASTFNMVNNVSITTDQANIILSGAGSSLQSYNTTTYQQTTLDSTLTLIGASGQLHLLAGRNMTTGAALTDSGTLELGGGTLQSTSLTVSSTGTLVGYGTVNNGISDAGQVEAKGGALNLAGAVNGSGGLLIDAGATLELGSTTASTDTVTFNGLGATLKLDSPTGFAGVLDNLSPGNTIDLAGVTATGAAASGTTLTITESGGSTLAYTLGAAVSGERFAVATDGHSGTNVTAYALAQPNSASPSSVNFGNVHVGSTTGQALTITNTVANNGYGEKLDASISPNGAGATATGSFTGLAPQATDSSSLNVGINTSVDGVVSGTATIALSSDGAGVDGLAPLALASQTASVSGTVYAYAAPRESTTTLNLGAARVGDTGLQASLTLSNGAVADPYQENLAYSVSALSPAFTGPAAGTVASGGSASVGVGLSTATAGDFTGSTATLNLTSKAGASGLSDTSLPGKTLTLNGKVYAKAVAQLGASNVDFGVVHVGDSVSKALGITNGASGALTDSLKGGFGTVTGPFSGSGTLAGLASGQSGSLALGMTTSSAGVLSGTANLVLSSHDGDLADVTVSAGPVSLSGTVDNYASSGFEELSGGGTLTRSGSAYTLDLGTIATGQTVSLSLGALNTATQLADLLAGTFSINGSSAYTNSGFGNFSGLGAGQADTALTVGLNTSTSGTYSETIIVHGTGSNASGYSGAVGDVSLTITASVGGGGQTYTLTTGPDTVTGTQYNDTVIARSGTLSAGDHIDGGGGTNTLVLQGGGTFNLAAPATLANIQVVNAQEGRAGGSGDANVIQTVTLRAGTSFAVNVASDPNTGTGTPGIVIVGANNTDTITLGSGTDTVTLGGTGEVVHAGGGNDVFKVTAATIGATVDGGTGKSTLSVSGGGTMAMGSNITNVATVSLAALTAGQSAYNFTANGQAGLAVLGSTSGGDTVTLGAGSQSYSAYGSNDHVLVTAANAGAKVLGKSGGNTVLEITGGGSAALNAGTSNVTVQLDAATNLSLARMSNVSVQGSSGNDTFTVAGWALGAQGSLDGGGGTNTLVLQGGGTFNLAAPATLANIQVVNAQEGRAGGSGDANVTQTVTLRAGTSFAVNVASDTNTGTGTPGIVIVGANNTDTITLGSGNDTVTLGGTGEVVHAGGGNDVFKVTAATIGATVDGGTGKSTLSVSGGGTMAMGSNITNVGTVRLAALTAGQSAYNFTANGQAGLAVLGSTSGGDTVTLGAGSQNYYAYGSNDRVLVTAANAGARVLGKSGGNTVLEITGGGSAALNAGTSNVTVQLDAATNLTLNKLSFITAVGSSGNDTIQAGGSGQTLTGGAGADTLIGASAYGDTFRDTSAGLNGDTIKLFGGSDAIDLTDMGFSSLSLSYAPSSSTMGTLTVGDGTHSAAITMIGSYRLANFVPASDNGTGTLITYHA